MVKKNWLIVINGLLWMVAGMNIANRFTRVVALCAGFCRICDNVFQDYF